MGRSTIVAFILVGVGFLILVGVGIRLYYMIPTTEKITEAGKKAMADEEKIGTENVDQAAEKMVFVPCWDLNANGVCDLKTENFDKDCDCDVDDCCVRIQLSKLEKKKKKGGDKVAYPISKKKKFVIVEEFYNKTGYPYTP